MKDSTSHLNSMPMENPKFFVSLSAMSGRSFLALATTES